LWGGAGGGGAGCGREAPGGERAQAVSGYYSCEGEHLGCWEINMEMKSIVVEHKTKTIPETFCE